jgi:hypothetical protein
LPGIFETRNPERMGQLGRPTNSRENVRMDLRTSDI